MIARRGWLKELMCSIVAESRKGTKSHIINPTGVAMMKARWPMATCRISDGVFLYARKDIQRSIENMGICVWQ